MAYRKYKKPHLPNSYGGVAGGAENFSYINYFSYMDANKSNLHHYNPHLQKFANKLRKEMTKAEACLWKYALRAGMMKGYSFRRQRPVLKYIADFMCMDLMLIIEVDGLTHTWEETFVKDITRENELKKAGFTILRFSDNDVLSDMENVKRCIYTWIEEFELAKG